MDLTSRWAGRSSDELATITINYTSGTTGQAQGRHVHPPRRLPEQPRRAAPLRAQRRQRLPVDAADVPLQRLVHGLGRDRHRRAPRVPARGARRPHLAAHRAGERHPPQRRAYRVAALVERGGGPRAGPAAGRSQRPAAPPSPKTIAQCEAISARVVHVYGLTETYGPYSVCQWQEGWEDARRRRNGRRCSSRQGVGMIQAERLRVVDERRRIDVPADGATMGEIVMRGNNVMKGYFRDEEATAEAFAAAGSTPATSASCTPTATSQLLDRAKDVVISGGENISTVEVEQAVLAHDAVLDAAVIGCPTKSGASGPRRSSCSSPARRPASRSSSTTSASTHRPLQGAESSRVPRRAPNDLDGQDPEVRAAGARVGWASLPNQGMRTPCGGTLRARPDRVI